MNNAGLIATVATKLNIEGKTKKEITEKATAIVDAVIGTIIEGAKADGKCTIAQLGDIVVAETKATSGTAPSGAKWTKPAGKVIKLKLNTAGKALV